MKHLQAAFLIRTGLCADPNPVQALNTMRIRIQGAKPMQIRILVRLVVIKNLIFTEI
jgi:hypothetical protein